MPNSISHQAPALYLKMKFPKWIDGPSICIGAIVPDLTLWFSDLRKISHSLLGQVIWTLPITLILTFIFSKYLASLLSKIAQKKGFIPKVMNYFGMDNWSILANKKYDRKVILVIIYSSIIGGLTHLLLDLPSHRAIELFYPWAYLRNLDFLWIPLADLGTISILNWHYHVIFMVSDVIWIVEDLIFFIISLYLFRIIKKKELLKKWESLNP